MCILYKLLGHINKLRRKYFAYNYTISQDEDQNGLIKLKNEWFRNLKNMKSESPIVIYFSINYN